MIFENVTGFVVVHLDAHESEGLAVLIANASKKLSTEKARANLDLAVYREDYEALQHSIVRELSSALENPLRSRTIRGMSITVELGNPSEAVTEGFVRVGG